MRYPRILPDTFFYLSLFAVTFCANIRYIDRVYNGLLFLMGCHQEGVCIHAGAFHLLLCQMWLLRLLPAGQKRSLPQMRSKDASFGYALSEVHGLRSGR